MRQVLFAVLSVVAANPGINQGAVGRVLGIKRANMVSLINELVDRGWSPRASIPPTAAPSRSTTNVRTAQRSTNASRGSQRMRRRMLAGFTDEEKATLLDLLGRIDGATGGP